MEIEGDGKMFYHIGKRIQKEPIKAYHKRNMMDINQAHDLFNHMSEQVLRQTCIERKIKLTSQLKPCSGCLYAKAARKRIMKTSNIGGSQYWFKVVDDYS